MAGRRVGIWLVGARGGVATTVAVGLAALRADEAPQAGLVTEGPDFEGCDLVDWDQLVIGGHEVRRGTLAEAAQSLEAQQGALPPGSAARCADELAKIDARIRPGVLFRSGRAIEAIADKNHAKNPATPREAIDAVAADLAEFRDSEQLERVVVVLVGSTEPVVDPKTLPPSWDALAATLEGPAEAWPLRMSALYAIAAIEQGMPLVNFTPSLGADCAAIEELAVRHGVPHCGRDGKTGETLLKSVLAPMFAERQLEVMSWVSHNMLGNRDGVVLTDPDNKKAKIESKEKLLEGLLGYSPQSHVSIESIASLGDWKTAWDHIHFRGFLGVPMTLQFTWQGCDSALAAPLVLDLVRLMDFAARREESGTVSALGVFFKSPMGKSSDAFAEQVCHLSDWATR